MGNRNEGLAGKSIRRAQQYRSSIRSHAYGSCIWILAAQPAPRYYESAPILARSGGGYLDIGYTLCQPEISVKRTRKIDPAGVFVAAQPAIGPKDRTQRK
jgi:hypothetical protein